MQLARLSQHSFGIRMASPVTLHGSVPSNSLGAGMRHLRGLTLRDWSRSKRLMCDRSEATYSTNRFETTIQIIPTANSQHCCKATN